MGTRAFEHIVRGIPAGCFVNPAGATVVTNKYDIDPRCYLCTNIVLLSHEDCHEMVR